MSHSVQSLTFIAVPILLHDTRDVCITYFIVTAVCTIERHDSNVTHQENHLRNEAD